MRNQWRLLLLRTVSRSPRTISTPSSLPHLRSTSILHTLRSISSLPSPPPFVPSNLTNPIARNFSSDGAVVAGIFGEFSDPDDVTKHLEWSNIEISPDLALKVLSNLEDNPAVAQRVFNWVLSTDEKKLTPECYNVMLQILGTNGLVEEFWDLFSTMTWLKYDKSTAVLHIVLKKFEKDGLVPHAEKLRMLFHSWSVDDPEEKDESRVCKIIRRQPWGEGVEGQLRDLNVTYSSDLVKMVLENLRKDPRKALMFFRWIEESGLCKHDEPSYNAMARALAKEFTIDRFWKLVEEMRGAGYEMEMETFDMVFSRFCSWHRTEEAVALLEFAMGGANKPSVNCCTMLLKKIAAGKTLDMGLFSRAVKAFVAGGYNLTDSTFKSVLSSLTSADRLEECNEVLKAMEDVGYVPSVDWRRRVSDLLRDAGKLEEASKLMDIVEESADCKLETSVIEGYCNAHELEKTADCLQKMVDKEGASSASRAVDLLVNAYLKKNKAVDAYKLLYNLVSEKQLKPWHETYKVLISKLLAEGGFNDALNLLVLMRNDRFPSDAGPFIEYVSKSGSSDDAVAMLDALTLKIYPKKAVYVRLFEAFLKDGKMSEAQDILSKCPPHIQNSGDVLNLLRSMKSAEAAPEAS